jgi:hypothetical protein
LPTPTSPLAPKDQLFYQGGETLGKDDAMIVVGIIVTVLGLAGLMYCIASAFRARRAGLSGEELTDKLKRLVAVNLAAFFLSAIGLAIIVFSVIL